jgi:quinol-cytochrome oxidoreductase complex cytochrome b subunit
VKNQNAAKRPGIIGKLDEMFPFDWEILREAGAEPVPHHLKKWWFCLGGTVLYLFMIQVITGIALSFYYVPYPEDAYQSVTRITHDVRFGWYIRSLHRWASHFLIVALILHMMRIYFTGAYRHPRQINWIIGSLLFFLSLMFGFTGYSLIFEQQSYWGATVAANLTEAVPLIGPTLANILRGGPEIGVNTLTRFHILHIGLLPTLSFILIALHIFLIRLHGVTELYFKKEVIQKEKKFFRFFPDHVITELIIGMLLLYLLTMLVLIYPIGLGPPVDPNVTPEYIKPEWYFYSNFRLLKLTSLNVLFISILFFSLTVLFWPFIEEYLQKKFKMPEIVSVIIGIVCFLILVMFTVWESLST